MNERLRQARISAGLKQIELADILGISKSLLNKYENTSLEPNHDMLIKISRVLRVSIDYLLGNTNDVTTTDLNNLQDNWRKTLIEAILADLPPESLILIIEAINKSLK